MHIQSLSSREYTPGFSIARPDAAAVPQQQSIFADAVTRKTGSAREEDAPGLYGADARMLKTLKERDQAARDAAEREGEAVGGRQFVYQTGPDGRQYAVGSMARVIRREDDDAAGSLPGDQAAASGARPEAADAALQQKLEARDAKVRAHEMGHVMAGGGQAQGLPQYTYQTGPDGRSYAVGGAVNISITSSGDAEGDARQADTARRAALATGETSARDALTANQAGEMASRARQRALNAYAEAGQDSSSPDLSLTA